ncbi:chromosome segregation protein SMC [Acinetobacter lwoffii]|uniref:Chromosome partition protein Smc n=1 Tax=Acinetobacter lwoffii NCTC 5866 = CIP 64.10 = NIPH 512 TaxID=981327 RepID=A0ABN0PXL9_ACILW|nr:MULTISPECIES: chromosome segregation protein SMC [Acinetobacter]ENU15897.1 chromosome segregation protein SMC [Acinetobacter sp. CIP A162]ESJ95257.1 chromosome segregation protein SMC [Acinetobacter lwoffii NCTC 5866 = CIP 64.10 = NIPH 512]QXB41857.1 chromosome segregation protein SMC [Acinetobacter lwoffii]SUU32944.1 Putative chromosome segregation ATPase [Acinetobacter lwoffii]VFQ36905.1 Putative chromosome segregation ATPase [Acinetobacter lwoffii]
MRLSSLKLSGFKSFADSTTLHFKDNRTAVVGPNGCGKSNVIDAIRWVMGESSARQLRGGSMQDVIFTGTAKRKPVGMASVELRFDNTYGKLGGAYNAYNELAVRRQVNRDGKSEYFLNGSKCRRRDITDIFLGTGLGPRSYAIIEQGMINRLVDAKPDEMRVYIEEAAGVSRYQARRRETMLHLDHTTQNLSRLEDIASELKSQLKTLKRQSESAIQYKELEGQIRTIKIEILSFQCEQSQRLQEEYTLEMNTLGENFKLVRSELTTVEHDLGSTSELFQRLIQQSTPLQSEWQQAEKKLAELEMTLQQKQSLLEQNSTSLIKLEQQKVQTKERLQLIELQLETLQQQLEDQQAQLQQQDGQSQAQSQNLTELKAQHSTVAAQFTQIKTQVEQQQQRKLQMLAQSEQLAKNIERIEQQKQTLQQQSAQIQQQAQQDELDQYQADKAQAEQQIVGYEIQLTDLRTQFEQMQAEQANHQQRLMQLKSEIQVLHSEKKNLSQLLTKANPNAKNDAVQLMHVLKLNDAGKGHASLIEKFLAKWLSAQILAEGEYFLEDCARQLKQQAVQNKIQIANTMCLADWIESPHYSLWQQVAVVDTLAQALPLQTDLLQGQSILSLDGYHVGSDWVIALDYDEASQAGQGALSHRIRLDEIEQQLAELEPKLMQLEQQLPEFADQVKALQNQIQSISEQHKHTQKQLQQLDVNIAKVQSSAQAFALQKQQLQHQLQQLDEQLEEDAMQKDDLEIDLHALNIKLEQALPNYKTLQFQLEELSTQLDDSQQLSQQAQQELEVLRRQNVQSQQQIELLEKDQVFLKEQSQQITAQIEQAKKFVDPVQLELPALQSQFNEQAQITEKLQKTWADWQIELNQVQSKQQQLTEQRHSFQQQDEKLRSTLEEKRLAWQAAKSDLQHYSEQLKELNSEVISGLNIDLKAHQAKLEKAQAQFDKLGAVNLAASEEYEEVSKRYEELSHQMQDLENTVEQLQAAMKSIDQETRKLFMHTFDQVNAELQNLFPKVFEGGEASLSLEDGWQSGVKLMARPPGKRNSSLALLSGGEKALTALALVFAIFRLNPAPFCVLDEVDAPLDDANVGRFCNLVKELSEHVQFIYITHNKLAMMMATDLLGVTMPEPGTSKLVTVNLEQAKEYGLAAEV